MASISSNSLHINLHTNPIISLHLSSSFPSILSFPFYPEPSHKPRFCALKIGPVGIRASGSSLRKAATVDSAGSYSDADYDDEDDGKGREDEGEDLDWEDRILEDTVPLVGFVRMLLHSDKYEIGERLSPEHERIILERLLPYHPEYEKKIGSGVDYIMVGYHPDFESSKCLFIVRKNGELEDFSYWKCLKGLIRKKYPLHADIFILRHFRKRKHYNY